jgi:deoxyribonuclease-4
MSFKIGFHVSIAGGIDKSVDRALKIGCTTFQIFTRNPRSWSFKELDTNVSKAFISKCKDAKIDLLFAHMPYLANLSSPEDEIYQKSVQALIEELGFEIGLRQICNAIEDAYKQSKSRTQLLLENTGSSKASMGNNFNELRRIVESLNYPTSQMIGLCFDTCHAFVSGYELRESKVVDKLVLEILDTIGTDRLKLIHANDAKYEKGSHRDRHEHIGEGNIGKNGFRSILANPVLRKLPWILETPRRSTEDDLKNLHTMQKLYQDSSKKIDD